jgi:hypothetical protein
MRQRQSAASIVIRAAHVVAALVTDQFAFQLAQPRAADRAIEHRLILAGCLLSVFEFSHRASTIIRNQGVLRAAVIMSLAYEV